MIGNDDPFYSLVNYIGNIVMAVVLFAGNGNE